MRKLRFVDWIFYWPPTSPLRWEAAIGALLAITFLSPPARALGAAPETGACSLESATPATVAAVDDDFDLLLDDGRRAAIAGVEFPPPAKGPPDLRATAHKRLSDWLAGRDVFLGAFAGGPNRWGHVPARVYAAQGDVSEASLVSVGALLLEEGLARFRPDPAAEPCARDYLASEALARDAGRGLWTDPGLRAIDAAKGAGLLHRKGMTVLEGRISSVGESRGGIYLNFGQKRAEDFAVVILRRNLGMFQASGIEPWTLIGRRARVRGLIETGLGPRMEISTPAEIEILENKP